MQGCKYCTYLYTVRVQKLFCPFLKGLSYQIDVENVDEIDRSWPERGPRLVFEFFGGTSDF